MTEPRNDHADAIAALATDPLQFIALCWPDMKLSEAQRKILQSVLRNVETFVPAANKTGKSRIAAIITIWFFFSRTPARVIVTSASESQVQNVLWREIMHLVRTSAVPLPFEVRELRLSKLSPVDGRPLPQDYLLGQVTRSVESFQGHHLPSDKPRVLVIFDEASGVPDEFYEAAQSWAHRILVIGNPLTTDNFFYARCRQGDQADPAGGPGLLRKVIPLDGRESPNVLFGRQWIAAGNAGPPPVQIDGLMTYPEFCRLESQWDEVQRTTRLYGQFYEGPQTRLFPAGLLDDAMNERRWRALQQQKRKAEAMGVDVAMGGRDLTCFTIIDRYGIIEQIALNMESSMEIAGMTIRLMEQYGLPAVRVLFDAGGGGKQIADRLHELQHSVRTLNFGEAAEDRQAYTNRRTELYGHLRTSLDPDREEGPFCLPPGAGELRAELNVLPLRYNSEGRLELPPKQHRGPNTTREKSIRQLLGRSPDRADSLVLAVWVLRLSRYDDDFRNRDLVYDADGELTAEDFETMHPEMRELIQGEMQLNREAYLRRRWGDEWFD